MRTIHRLLIIFTIGASLTPVLQAQEPIELTFSPRSVEQPLMKYRLLPAEYEKKEGNAATIILRLPWEQHNYITNVLPTIDEYLELPLDDPNLLNAKDIFNPIWYEELKRAAFRSEADWEYPIGEESYYHIRLPDVQFSRSILGRGLSVWIRHQLAHGKIDKAMEGIKVGLANTQHLGRSPFIITQLVCVGLNGMMFDRIEELLAQPECPNLYWALTALPQPFQNSQPSYDMEQHSLFMDFPELQNPENIHSDKEWKSLAHRVYHIMIEANQRRSLDLADSKEQAEVISSKIAKVARNKLSEISNLTQPQIKSMSDAEAGLRYFVLVQKDLFHQQKAYSLLKASEAIPRLVDLKKQYLEFRKELDLENYDLLFAESAHRGYFALHKIDRRIAALRVIEALRHYAATHGGKFPSALAEIDDLPIPLDPFTEKPFQYQLKDGVASLSGPTMLPGTSPYNEYSLNYRLKLAQPK